MRSNSKIAIVAIAKLENNYIREWIEHYKSIGVDKIYIADNNDEDDERISDVIQDYINEGFVEVLDYRGLCYENTNGLNIQDKFYHNICLQIYKQFDFIATFDIDEFLVLDRKYKDIHEFLSEPFFKNFDQIRVCWKIFGDNDLVRVYDNNYSIKRFTKGKMNGGCKSIIRTKNILNPLMNWKENFLFVHGLCAFGKNSCDTSGKKLDYSNTKYGLIACLIKDSPLKYNDKNAIINHYITKTIEEYVSVKMKRCYPDQSKSSSNSKLNLANFFRYNRKTDEKLNYINSLGKETMKIDKSNFLNHLNKFKSNVSISVIVPAYKAQDFIEECLDSIQNQSYFKYNDNYEILVGIDGCEQTLKKVNEIKGKYKNLRIFYGENRKCPITRNSLINYATYDNIITFDSDDYMLPDMITEIVKEIRNNDIKFCRYKCLYDCLDFKLKNNIDYYYKNNIFPAEIFKKSSVNYVHGSIYVNKKIWKNLNGFSNYKFGDDTDMDLRLENYIKKNNLTLAFIDIPLMIVRQHNESITHKNNEWQKEHTYWGNVIRKRINNNDLINKELLINETMKELNI